MKSPERVSIGESLVQPASMRFLFNAHPKKKQKEFQLSLRETLSVVRSFSSIYLSGSVKLNESNKFSHKSPSIIHVYMCVCLTLWVPRPDIDLFWSTFLFQIDAEKKNERKQSIVWRVSSIRALLDSYEKCGFRHDYSALFIFQTRWRSSRQDDST